MFRAGAQREVLVLFVLPSGKCLRQWVSLSKFRLGQGWFSGWGRWALRRDQALAPLVGAARLGQG